MGTRSNQRSVRRQCGHAERPPERLLARQPVDDHIQEAADHRAEEKGRGENQLIGRHRALRFPRPQSTRPPRPVVPPPTPAGSELRLELRRAAFGQLPDGRAPRLARQLLPQVERRALVPGAAAHIGGEANHVLGGAFHVRRLSEEVRRHGLVVGGDIVGEAGLEGELPAPGIPGHSTAQKGDGALDVMALLHEHHAPEEIGGGEVRVERGNRLEEMSRRGELAVGEAVLAVVLDRAQPEEVGHRLGMPKGHRTEQQSRGKVHELPPPPGRAPCGRRALPWSRPS